MVNSKFNEMFPHELQGLPGLRLTAPDNSAVFITAQGAQPVSWTGSDGRERLYLSASTGGMRRGAPEDTLSAAIRGGIPVCFPQFSGRGPMVKHGFARSLPWQCESHGNPLQLSLTDSDASRKHWPHAFLAQVTVALATDTLKISLEVSNNDTLPWSFTTALHTYLRVADIRKTRVMGLHNARYQDATANNVEVIQREEALTIPGEVDRVYLSPSSTLLLAEGDSPSLRISQHGFADTVVWNPGPEKARALNDMPDDDWLHMLCVEAAAVAVPVTLDPGQRWSGSQTLEILRG